MTTDRKFGLIFREQDDSLCRSVGVLSDSEKIAKLEAPWDSTDKPSITTWDSWRPYLEEEAEKMDKLREAGYPTHFWDLTKKWGIDNDTLFGTTQLQNDCTAWATCRCYLALLCRQILTGSEHAIEAVNQMALYAASGGDLRVGAKIPNGGRTIDAIAQASCESGMYPVSAVGEYNGKVIYTTEMANSSEIAEQHQMGWCNYSSDDGEQIVKDITLSLRAGYPVLIGNLLRVKDGTEKDGNGVYVATADGRGWGGGHATSFLDYCNVNGADYCWWANSHGNLYQSDDGSPSWGAYLNANSVYTLTRGSYFDIKFATYAESTRKENTNLNPEVVK